MKGTWWKKYGFCMITALLLTGYTGYALLDTFVIPHRYEDVSKAKKESTSLEASSQRQSAGQGSASQEQSAGQGSASQGKSAEQVSASQEQGDGEKEEQNETKGEAATIAQTVVTDHSYQGEGISIEITEYRVEETTVYVADVLLSDVEYLKTAFAYDTYGKNVKADTSQIAQEHNAILAINGDFYGARNAGYVIREGVLYRERGSGQEDLVIYQDGSFGIIREDEITARELLEKGAWNVFSFGPALVQDGEIAVSEGEEVGKAMASNPRTAIGILEEGHYLMVVSDGRTRKSSGLSLRELAEFLQDLGVETAYNLDGGGSSTMVFRGNLVNQPTTGGQSISERSVSDVIYVGIDGRGA